MWCTAYSDSSRPEEHDYSVMLSDISQYFCRTEFFQAFLTQQIPDLLFVNRRALDDGVKKVEHTWNNHSCCRESAGSMFAGLFVAHDSRTIVYTHASQLFIKTHGAYP